MNNNNNNSSTLDQSTNSSSDQSSPLSASVVSSSSRVARQPAPHRFSTLCATIENPDQDHQDRYGSSSVPIYQSSTFKGVDGLYDYTRSGNPSRTFLQHHVAKISKAKHAFAVSSGMAALDVILRTLQPGDEIIAGNDLYGGSNRLLTYVKEHNGIITHHIDTTNLENLKPFLVKDSRVRMVLLESPTNPLLQIVDIEAVINLVKAVIPEAIIVVDNTMMSPYLMKPLEFGADVVYDSGTKYLSGHHDVMAGLVTCNSDKIAKQLAFVINSIGNGLAPFECFLLTRGIKTLSLRMDRQQASAIRVAKYLDQLGFKVNFPGLAHHKGKEIHDRLAKGPGAVLSFETGDKKLSEKIVSSARLWSVSVSFGCVNSLISMPCLMSHASIDPAVRAARNLPEDLIRLCVGIEDPDDLLEELQAALVEAGAIRILDETRVDSGYERVGMNSLPISPAEAMIPQKDYLGSSGNPTTLLVSAPGKIILFGEHAVVYGKKAIAAAVNRRCYCFVEPGGYQTIETVALCLPDSGWSGSWPINQLPWDCVKPTGEGELHVNPQLSQALLTKVAGQADKNSVLQAAHAFLYLFMHLATKENRRSQVFTIRSTLPIGAGLGSSASYSVCLASALLYSHQHIAIPTQKGIETTQVETINRWAFLGEKILHGSPSGVDNTVSSFGGAICFQKLIGENDQQKRQSIEQIQGFGAIRILISDTQVPRDTKSLVAGVAQKKEKDPKLVQSILDEIEELTISAQQSIKELAVIKQPDSKDGQNPDQELLKTKRNKILNQLGHLMARNHSLLSSLGVGHSQLDLVKSFAANCGLETKLTGAGGGGCAITLIPDNFEEEKLSTIVTNIEAHSMKAYETEIGVSGVGILNNLDHHHQLLESVKKIYLTSDLTTLSQSLSNPSQALSRVNSQPDTISNGVPSAPGVPTRDLFWSFA
ncbi:cystathionine beta-lyase [Puccinia graminis f. sp. tritici]|uniref:Cystathionine beta-lyase n=1 Tax=Puccinia graminis f. sp. tritici TaxID=56615 RepID=A0A5B0N1Q0_PUCGR|nr:cystathionine beta-lyase [Puccinia graminis f. sp. tritici]